MQKYILLKFKKSFCKETQPKFSCEVNHTYTNIQFVSPPNICNFFKIPFVSLLNLYNSFIQILFDSVGNRFIVIIKQERTFVKVIRIKI